jgi:hypothetical protein
MRAQGLNALSSAAFWAFFSLSLAQAAMPTIISAVAIAAEVAAAMLTLALALLRAALEPGPRHAKKVAPVPRASDVNGGDDSADEATRSAADAAAAGAAAAARVSAAASAACVSPFQAGAFWAALALALGRDALRRVAWGTA